MKIQSLITAFAVLLCNRTAAQQIDTAQVLVYYKFTHVKDTSNRDHPYTQNMVLFAGRNASVYKSYDRQLEDALFKKQVAEQKANSPDGNLKINRQSNGSGTEYYQFPHEKKLFTKERLFNNYLIAGNLPAMDWKINGDTATFGGLHCQQAQTFFKGRHYTAWFCPDLPMHTGPWKLNGLPGLIIQAYDDKQEVLFMFDRVEKAIHTAPVPVAENKLGNIVVGMDESNADPNVIELPHNAIRSTEKEFKKLVESVRKNPEAFAQSILAAQAPSMQGNGQRSEIKIKVGPQPVINNPIEK